MGVRRVRWSGGARGDATSGGGGFGSARSSWSSAVRPGAGGSRVWEADDIGAAFVSGASGGGRLLPCGGGGPGLVRSRRWRDGSVALVRRHARARCHVGEDGAERGDLGPAVLGTFASRCADGAPGARSAGGGGGGRRPGPAPPRGEGRGRGARRERPGDRGRGRLARSGGEAGRPRGGCPGPVRSDS